jgi:hypothetical protein
MALNKQTLINQATPDSNISDLQTKQPKVYQAIKNLGDVTKTIINTSIPVTPLISFRETFIIPGNPSVANDVLNYRYHVILPFDSQDNWTYESINLTGAYITAKIQGTSTVLSVDIKVSQQKGARPFKSLFKSTFNPKLPPGVSFTNNVMFAINLLFQDDLIRIDVLVTDPTVSGISIDLIGNYIISEN